MNTHQINKMIIFGYNSNNEIISILKVKSQEFAVGYWRGAGLKIDFFKTDMDFNADEFGVDCIFENKEEITPNRKSIPSLEKELIANTIKKLNRADSAKELGISERTLYRKLLQYDLPTRNKKD